MNDENFNIEIGSNDRQRNIEDDGGLDNELINDNKSIDEGKEKTGLFLHERQLVGAYVNHILTRLLIILMIFLDIIFVFIGLALPESSKNAIHALDVISLLFVIIFLIELCLRIFVEMHNFYKSWFNLLDGFIIVISFLVAVLLALLDYQFDNYAKFGQILVIGRIFRAILLVRSVRLVLMTEGFQRSMRLTVGGNKQRYQKDGYDLDLCYITKRVIAMSFPSSGIEGVYRNKIEHVSKFLDEKHPNKYKVYNLCSEKCYETHYFHDRVERFMIDDHNVPTLKEAIRFAKDVKQWMSADPYNCIAVHCKGGKGRTGTMICIWLLESRECANAKEALQKFGDRRTNWEKGKTFQGVETPSQSRFVGYFDVITNHLGGLLPSIRNLRLKKVNIFSIANIGNSDGSDFSMLVYLSNKHLAASCIFNDNTNCKVIHDKLNNMVEINEIKCDLLSEEVKILFYSSEKEVPKYYDECAFFFTFHTSFIDTKTNSLKIMRNELDNPHKEKFWNVYKEDFGVEMFFE